MIDPRAIFELEEENDVATGDGQENVSQIAVWDWYQRSPDGETSKYELHTSDGELYVDTADVDEITELT